MFRAGCDKYNDYDTGEMRIRHDPFRVVKIPPKNIADKKMCIRDRGMPVRAVGGNYGSRFA